MKKLWNILVLLLAIHFVAACVAVAWLWKAGHLDRERITAIKELVFPKPAPEAPATQPTTAPSTQPLLRLDELLARKGGPHSAVEQVDFIQHTFDAKMAELDRRFRELADLQRQVDLANAKLKSDRDALTTEQSVLTAREREAERLAADQGFQDSLELYKTMQGKQVKNVFMTLGDDVVVRYLRAMEPRSASRIIKEFKSPQELERVQGILEKMRQADAAATAAGASADESAAAASAQGTPQQ